MMQETTKKEPAAAVEEAAVKVEQASSPMPAISSNGGGGGDDGLVPGEEQAVRAWLVEQGFEDGDLRSEKVIDYRMMTPMMRACYKGELNVCKWLYNHGAAEDISRANNF